MNITKEQLIKALTEWDRRWQENPDDFLSYAKSLAQDPSDYGEAAAPYLLEIIKEQKSK